MDAPDIILKVCQALNPTLLPAVENGNLLHKCTETVKQTYSVRSSLLGEPHDNPKAERFIDGSSLQRWESRWQAATVKASLVA